MIFIDSFEESIEPWIIERGLNYFNDGAIEELDISDGEVYATVSGTYDYEVCMNIDEHGNILTSYCDCPYDGGEFCKHEVAVMYAIREYFKENNASKTKKFNLKEALLKQSPEVLADIICELADENHTLKKKLTLRFKEYSDSLEDCINLIWQYINASKKKGIVLAEDVDYALEGAYKVLEIADNMAQKDYVEAAKRYMAIIDIISELEVFYIEYYWNGAEEYRCSASFYNEDEASCPDEIFELIYDATKGLGNLAQYDEDNKLFKVLLERMDGDLYSCYYDACVWFCGKSENRKLIEKNILLLSDKNEILRRTHFLIKTFDGEEAENNFLEENINIGYFRDIAIDNAMRAGNYERVIYLEETSNECVDVRSYDYCWKKTALSASRELGDAVRMKKYLTAFIIDGHFDYNEQLKEICSADEWKKQLRIIIDAVKIKNLYRYTELLIKEQQFDELFVLCKNHNYKILEFYSYFAFSHREEAAQMFFKEAINHASKLCDRRGYNELCNTIKDFGKYYGADKAVKIIDVLKINHKRQRAFLDELRKIESSLR